MFILLPVRKMHKGMWLNNSAESNTAEIRQQRLRYETVVTILNEVLFLSKMVIKESHF